jgi:penicillin-binding protein 2
MASLKRFFRKKFAKRLIEIDPDVIFLDSSNLPKFNTHQFEGRIEKPIASSTTIIFLLVVFFVFIGFSIRLYGLAVVHGDEYAKRSETNRLDHDVVFADRGSILDKNGIKLAWNAVDPDNDAFSTREYIHEEGFSHLLGFVRYPTKDKNGNYFRKDFEGVQGIEKAFNVELKGENGLRIIEIDALGKVYSESSIRQPKMGENLTLSIDSDVQKKMFDSIKGLADRVGFTGGTGAIMDVETGEVLAATSYPEFSSNAMASRDGEKIASYNSDKRMPFMFRLTNGLYAPGSIVKPYVALGALSEKVIDPSKTIVSNGYILVQNPYDPTKNTRFNDWKAHGPVDMRKAISVSSDVYFYEVGGGFGDQKGLGIANLDKYFSLAGFGKPFDDKVFGGPAGTIPTPEWKAKAFPGDPWRVGDTYFTSIGQYGFQVTPIQALRAVASIANEGFIIEPTAFPRSTSSLPVEKEVLPFSKSQYEIIHEGMRMGATTGTASGLNVPYVKVAAKTGTAQLGVSKSHVNSWVTGFFPYEHPRYAFVITMERGPSTNIYGATFVMRELLDWMNINKSEYLVNKDE